MRSAPSVSAILGFYLLLALAPLFVAAAVHEPAGRSVAVGPHAFTSALASAAGFVALAFLALEFLLVARVRLVSTPIGTDALALLHRQMGIAAAAFALAHVVLAIAGGAASVRWLDPFRGAWPPRLGAIALWSALVVVIAAIARRRLPVSYETWRASHRLLALVIVGCGVAHALGAGAAASERPENVVLVALALGVGALAFHHRLLRPLALFRRPWRIVENRARGGSTRTLVLAPDGHAGMRFDAGQFAWLITGSSPFSRAQHPLSLASSAAREDGHVELAIKALGDWSSTTVPALAPGTRVWLDGPFGAFTPERVAAPGFVLLAGGIGITPMRSIVLTLRERRDPRPIVLFHAAARRDRAVFTELAELADERLSVVPVYEEGDLDPRVERGRIDAALLARRLPPDFRRWAFFVCGPAPMMDALERDLRTLGVPAEQIHSERFDRI